MITDIMSTALFASAQSVGMPEIAGIEYTISLGNLLTMGSFLVFVTIYVVNSRGAAKILAARLEIMDANVDEFKLEIKKLGEILIGQALQDGRINLLEQRLMQEGNRMDALSNDLGDFKNMVLQDTLKRES